MFIIRHGWWRGHVGSIATSYTGITVTHVINSRELAREMSLVLAKTLIVERLSTMARHATRAEISTRRLRCLMARAPEYEAAQKSDTVNTVGYVSKSLVIVRDVNTGDARIRFMSATRHYRHWLWRYHIVTMSAVGYAAWHGKKCHEYCCLVTTAIYAATLTSMFMAMNGYYRADMMMAVARLRRYETTDDCLRWHEPRMSLVYITPR